MITLRDQHVLILGLGASGLSMARWCARQGAQVAVADTRAAPPQLPQLKSDVPHAQFVHAPLDAALIEGTPVRAVFVSPGLSPQQTAAVLDAARASGLWIGGELALFAQALADLKAANSYAPKVLAITGTNGKTTVTSLTGHLLRWSNQSVAVAGNIGPALLDTLARALDDHALPDYWVLELSSFQLDLPSAFEPTAATVLNVTQDHLDWHGNMDAYAQAKSRIFGRGLMVLNRDDAAVMAMQAIAAPTPAQAPTLALTPALTPSPAPAAETTTRPSVARSRAARHVEREVVTFGTGMPQRPGDFGLEDAGGMAWLVRVLPSEETRRARNAPAEELHLQRLMPADALRIRGRHNASNALAALALCVAGGCPLGPMLYGLREYRGEPHRVEPVGMLNGVEFFDDSKGTNVGATVAALQGLGSERKVVVILGGDGKAQDFAPLAQPVSRFARSVVVIGRDAPLIRAALEQTGVPLLDAGSMDDAVSQAHRAARPGDAVLMSPACASFDMFDNYEHRARAFVLAVRALALNAGVELEVLA
jgi:UDP-N-acetylmuramoylalanine--D-glutamate ligase